jgi:arylsulfatase A-like enzyme
VPPASSHYTSVKGDSAIDMQDRFVASLAVQMAKTMRPRALLVNLPSTDIAGHYYGGMADPQDMAEIARNADWAIGRIVSEYQQLGLLNRTLFVVTADHGMASNRHIVPIHPIYNAVRAANVNALEEELRITVGSIWLRDPQKAAALASTLAAKRFPGVEGALYRMPGGSFAATPSTAAQLSHSLLRAYLDLADTEAGPTGPDVILPYGEDTTGLTVAGRKLWGSHGGFSWGVQHIPLVLAGPGVRHGSSHFPAKLVDVAPTIERLLGLPIPQAVDGVVLADALAHATSTERSAQQSVRAGRLADLNALRAHSLAQSRR